MTLRQRIFIITSIILAILLAVLVYLLYGRKPTDTAPGTATNFPNAPATTSIQANQNPDNNQPAKPIIVLPAYSEDLYVRQVAKIFVERFASYSNQNGNNNIDDSLPLATEGMQKWMKTQLKPESRDYQGVVTEVLSSKLTEKTATTATVTIQTQQSLEQKAATSTGANKKEIIQRKATVKLVKVGSEWKVDALYWQ